jgi:phosphotransferase system HPr-like phosphotransfer protein
VTKVIRLGSFERVRKFIKITEKLPFELDLQQQRNVVDGKSLMGALTLNLCENIEMIIYSDESKEVTEFLNEISELIV